MSKQVKKDTQKFKIKRVKDFPLFAVQKNFLAKIKQDPPALTFWCQFKKTGGGENLRIKLMSL